MAMGKTKALTSPHNLSIDLSIESPILKYMLNNDTQLDRMFQALADTNRRALIEHLLAGPATVSELAAPLEITLPAVHQHLAVLETAGLVKSEKQGRVRTCTLDTMALTKAEVWISDRRKLWESRLDALGQFLTQSKEIK